MRRERHAHLTVRRVHPTLRRTGARRTNLMPRTRLLLLAPIFVALAAVAAAAVRAEAQDAPPGSDRQHPAVERYNRTAKGANVEEWKRRLSEPDVHTRLDAVDSLGSKGGNEAIRPLIEATADADFRVRTRAIDFLGSLRALEASPVLMQMLFLGDVRHDEKLRALTSLGRIADPSTSDRLANYARSIEDDDLACRATYALGEIADPRSKAKVAALKGTRPGTDMDRLVADALTKIQARENARPAEQPTLLQLEKKLAAQQEAQQAK